MKKWFLPYLLPLATLIIVAFIVFLNPNITGFAIRENNDLVAANIKIFTSSTQVLPPDAFVEAVLDGKSSSMSVKEFIEKNGSSFELKDGRLELIDYSGLGYTGDNSYTLSLDKFNLGNAESKNEHILKIKVHYNNKIISESSQVIQK